MLRNITFYKIHILIRINSCFKNINNILILLFIFIFILLSILIRIVILNCMCFRMSFSIYKLICIVIRIKNLTIRKFRKFNFIDKSVFLSNT